jgi:uncharacterized protein YjgD (DUF1641 family)
MEATKDPIEKLLEPRSMEAIAEMVDYLPTLKKVISYLAEMEKDGTLEKTLEGLKGLINLANDLLDPETVQTLLDWGLEKFSKIQPILEVVQKNLNQEAINRWTSILRDLESLLPLVSKLSELEKDKGLGKLLDLITKINKEGYLDNAIELLDQYARAITRYKGEFKELPDQLMSFLPSLLRALSSKEGVEFTKRISEALKEFYSNAPNARPIGRWGLISALGDPEVSKGLGVIIEFLRSLGKAYK